MCGIAGFLSFQSEGSARHELQAMTHALEHRGPDAEDFFLNPTRGIYLGHRRLSVLDQAGGAQPMRHTPTGVVVIFNGEIYNQRELRQELIRQGASFQSDHSDTEVLLEGYLHWGRAIVEKLDGMWAFLIYDPREKFFFLSRDRFGKKPLYYYYKEGRLGYPPFFACASELKALLKHQHLPRKLSLIALQKYFAYGYLPAPHTMYEGVFQLPAGFSGVFDLMTGRWSCSSYWSYQLRPEANELPADGGKAWSEELLELLVQAIAKRLTADVPIGLFLSGGVDSSAIAALMTQRLGGKSFPSFSIAFRESSFDESGYARLVAKHLGFSHAERRLDWEEVPSLLQPLLHAMDEPLSDSSLLPTAFLSQFARESVTVALSGDGGDELFAGYDPFVAMQWGKWYQKLMPKKLHPAILKLMAFSPTSYHNMSWDFKLKRFLRPMTLPPACWGPSWMGPLQLAEISELFGTSLSLEEIYSEAIEAWESGEGLSDGDRLSQFFVRLYLQNDILRKVDRASMLYGLEVRAPFLDRDLVDFVTKLPFAMKLRGGCTKWILKKALQPFLPKAILHRAKKGFGMPIASWLAQGVFPQEVLKPYWEDFLGQESLTRANIFWQERWHQHTSYQADHRLFLWASFMLRSWQESMSISS